MNASSALSEPISVITDVGEPVNQQSGPEPQTNFVTPKQFKEIEKQRQHQARVVKKRAKRWSQPFADAKIEDIQYVIQQLSSLGEKFNQLIYEHEVTRKALKANGVITDADLEAVYERDKERVAKANELRTNTTLSVEEKKAIAAEFDIPLAVIGLEEEPTKGDA